MSKIQLQPVDSSLIAAIGHDPETNTLAIQFHGMNGAPGVIYHYAGVDADAYGELSSAESIGRHFIRHIKRYPEKYPFTKQ